MSADLEVRALGRNAFEISANSAQGSAWLRWLTDPDDAPTSTGDGRTSIHGLHTNLTEIVTNARRAGLTICMHGENS